ncbi:MAG: hypothetical protein AAF742_03340 [Pseudomonadota bacterium]
MAAALLLATVAKSQKLAQSATALTLIWLVSIAAYFSRVGEDAVLIILLALHAIAAVFHLRTMTTSVVQLPLFFTHSLLSIWYFFFAIVKIDIEAAWGWLMIAPNLIFDLAIAYVCSAAFYRWRKLSKRL